MTKKEKISLKYRVFIYSSIFIHYFNFFLYSAVREPLNSFIPTTLLLFNPSTTSYSHPLTTTTFLFLFFHPVLQNTHSRTMSLINSTSALRQKLLPGIQKSISTIRAQRLHSARRLCKPSPTPQQQQPRIPYEPVAPGEKPISPHVSYT